MNNKSNKQQRAIASVIVRCCLFDYIIYVLYRHAR